MRLVLASKACLVSCLVSCLGHEPGEPLGTYVVTGALKTQTCGASMPAEDPWTFDVRLSKSGTLLFWLQDSAPPLSGTIDPAGKVTIHTNETFDLSHGDAGKAFCSVVRTDAFVAALGTTARPSSFTGSIGYHYELDQGATCPDLPALPCDVAYDLTAQRQ